MNGNDKSDSREQPARNPHQRKVFATMRPDPWSEAESFAPMTPPPAAPATPSHNPPRKPAAANSTLQPPGLVSPATAQFPLPNQKAEPPNSPPGPAAKNPASPSLPSARDTGTPNSSNPHSDTLAYAASISADPEDRAENHAASSERPSSADSGNTGSRPPGLDSSAPVHARSAISSWVGQAGSLQIRKCLVGGEISGVQQRVLTEQSPDAQSGHRSEYAIQNRLGKGGMGNVYRAQQTSLNRPLAVKALHSDLSNPQTVQRMFVAEALITAGLVHPNIVPLHDLAMDEHGRLFYSMKLVSGPNWQKVMPERTLEQNLDILLRVCDAVAYAHSRGVINRDLKPENVVVGEYGEVIVLDWGIAVNRPQFANPGQALTLPSGFTAVDLGPAGTPAYMAPEFTLQSTDRVCPQSDVYLLGAMLFELLEGQPPHLLKELSHITDPETLGSAVFDAACRNHIETDVRYSGELMQIALKAMETHPEDRYRTVTDFQDAIRQYRITGRAEELLMEAKLKHLDRYDEYQQSVALFANAIQNWPDNPRAAAGDAEAREAFASLALKRGDFDLGLEVVASRREPQLVALRKKLGRNLLQRKIIRGTWLLFGGLAAIFIALSVIYGLDARTQRAAADESRLALKDLSEKKKKLQESADSLEESAASLATANSELEQKQLQSEAKYKDSEAKYKDLQIQQDGLRVENEKLTTDANKQKRIADEAAEKARLAKSDTEKALAQASAANQAAEAALKKANQQAVAIGKQKIESLQELREWQSIVDVATTILDELSNNPEFSDAERKTIQSQLNEARRRASRPTGNLRREIPAAADSVTLAAISDNQQIVASIVTDARNGRRLRLIHSDFLTAEQPQQQIQFLNLPAQTQSGQLAVSPTGRFICLLTDNGALLWSRSNSGVYSEIGLPDLQPSEAKFKLGFCSFNANENCLFLVGGDKRSSIRILDLQSSEPKSLLQPSQTLFRSPEDSHICTEFVVAQDGNGILHFSKHESRSDSKCRFFPIEWKEGVPTLPENADSVPAFEVANLPGLPLANSDISLLQLTPKGNLLIGLENRNRDRNVLGILAAVPRTAQSGTGFPFAVLDGDPAIRWFQSREPQLPAMIRVSEDERTIVAAHNRKRDNLEVWDASGTTIVQAVIKGIESQATGTNNAGSVGTLLAGQSLQIRALGIPDDESSNFFTLDDKSLCRWNLNTWHELTDSASKVVKSFQQQKPPAAPNAGRLPPGIRRSPLSAALPNHRINSLGDAILTKFPLQPQDAAASGQQEISARPATRLYSAEFNADGSRVLVGTGELDARVLDAATLKPLENISNRPDPLAGDAQTGGARNEFQEGHKSNIVSLKFLPPNGDLLLTSENLGVISVWDTLADADGIGREESRLLTNLGTGAFTVSADGSLVLAGGATLEPVENSEPRLLYEALLWNTADLRTSVAPAPARRLQVDQPQMIERFRKLGIEPAFQITSTAISRDNKFGAAGGRRGELVIWSLADGSVHAVARAHNGDQVAAAVFQADGLLITAGYDGRVIRWTVDEATATLNGQTLYTGQQILQMEASADLSRLAIADLSPLRETVPGKQAGPRVGRPSVLQIRVLDADGTVLKTIRETRVLPGTSDIRIPFETGLAWSPDGSRLLLVQEGKLSVVNAADWSAERTLAVTGSAAGSARKPIRAAFSPATADGSLVATLGERQAHLWDLAKSTHLAEFRTHHSARLTASWSSDGKLMLTASDAVRLFNSADDSPNRGVTLQRIAAEINSTPLEVARFSPAPDDLRYISINQAGEAEIQSCSAAGNVSGVSVKFPAPTKSELPGWASDLNLNRFLSSARWSHDGQLVVLIRNGILSCWKTAGDQTSAAPLELPTGIDGRFNDAVFSPDAQVLAAAGLANVESEGQVRPIVSFWKRTADGVFKPAALLVDADGRHSTGNATGLLGGIIALALDLPGDRILTGGAGGEIHQWTITVPDPPADPQAELPRAVWAFEKKKSDDNSPHTAPLITLQFAPDGRLLSADRDGNLFIWPAD
ncbi:MAG: protein kinase domain-containing protein [Planctomycetaceae bacterium]